MPDSTSHQYRFRFPALLAHAGGPVAAAFGLLWIAGILDALEAFPRGGPESYADRVALHHQFQLSRSDRPAEIVLTGDSSCMMGVDAVELSRKLGGDANAVNLGLVFDMGMDIYAEAAKAFIQNNPGRVSTVVLLVTPQRLEPLQSNSYFLEMWNGFKGVEKSKTGLRIKATLSELRSLAETRALAQPLHQKGAGFYGFVEGIREYLQRHNGSGVDPGRLELRNRHARQPFQMDERYFGEADPNPWAVPERIRFLVGLMPVPETLAPVGYEENRREMLSTFASYFRADAALFELPASLPNGFFASVTHLNSRGQAYFTRKLAAVLAGFSHSDSAASGNREISPAK